jgi:hypothetical protein
MLQQLISFVVKYISITVSVHNEISSIKQVFIQSLLLTVRIIPSNVPLTYGTLLCRLFHCSLSQIIPTGILGL